MSEAIDTIEEGRGGHSTFSPSSSHGWLACADYIMANRGLPDTAGVDAATGTVFHSVMETWLRSDVRPDHLLGRIETVEAGGKKFEIEITQEMLDHAEECFSWVAEIPGARYVETRVVFDDLTPIPNQGGTCDLAFCQPGKLVTRDWKYGQGEWVDAERNPQLMLYAYGFFREFDDIYDFQTIDIGIGQPRRGNFDTWTCTRAELLAFAEDVRAKAAANLAPVRERKPTEKGCRWCKARPTCPAYASWLHAMADDAFDDLTAAAPVSADEMRAVVAAPRPLAEPGDPRELSTEDLARYLSHRKLFEGWFTSIAQELERRAKSGEHVPGFKLVQAASRRKWRSEEEAKAALRACGFKTKELHSQKFVTPAQAETALRARGIKKGAAVSLLSGFVVTPTGEQTLVRESDRREAQASIVEGSFDDLTNG